MNLNTAMGSPISDTDATNPAQPVARLIRTHNVPLSRRELNINYSRIALIHFLEAPHNNTVTTATTSPGGDYLIIGDDRGQVEVWATYPEWLISVSKQLKGGLHPDMGHGRGAESGILNSGNFMASPARRSRQ